MSSDVEIVRRPQTEGQMVEIDDARDIEQASNPLKTAHRLLQGKYPLVILLALLAGAVGALAAHQLVKDSYVSTGTIRIVPTLPEVLVKGDEISKFEAFVDFHSKLILSEKVLDRASQDSDLKQLETPAELNDLAVASSNLFNTAKVSHEAGSESIEIACTDTNILRPPVEVKSIIEAYLYYYQNVEEDEKAQRIIKLEKLKKDDTDKLDQANQRIRKTASKYGVDNLDQAINEKGKEIDDLKSALRKVQLELLGTDPTTRKAAAPRPETYSDEIWALSDLDMKRMMDDKRRLETEKEVMVGPGSNLGANHPRVLAQQQLIDRNNQDIEKRRQFLVANFIPGERNTVFTLPLQQEKLQSWITELSAERDTIVKESNILKETGLDVVTLSRELDEVSKTLRDLYIESSGKGRISVAELYTRVKLDGNKRRMATAGGGAGGALAVVGFFIILGLANRRMHRISDIQPEGSMNKGLRLLGAVPMLSADGSMSDNTPAAQAVHRIRTRLQIEAAASDRRVLTVTSPESGNGKTSVITALGMSFASSGSRVLLIDCDLVGAGLTARLNGRVRRNIVDILRSQTRVTEEQLAQAARVANKSSDRFLQALIDFEYLTPEQVKLAVTTHKESNLGLLDALNGEPLNQCVAATRWPRLFVLPRGAATGVDAAQLSPLALRRLFQQARNSFDVVLVDTGPLFGSIEATLAASESDGTVLVVSRGESAGAVQAAVTDLKSMKCMVMGAVFNRAKAKDVASYGYTSTSQSRSRPVASLTDDTDIPVGPIAAAGSGRNGDSSRDSSSRSVPVKKLANPDMPR